jgi:hypothetical protein
MIKRALSNKDQKTLRLSPIPTNSQRYLLEEGGARKEKAKEDFVFWVSLSQHLPFDSAQGERAGLNCGAPTGA